jgi:hypothetical protein
MTKPGNGAAEVPQEPDVVTCRGCGRRFSKQDRNRLRPDLAPFLVGSEQDLCLRCADQQLMVSMR